MEAMDATELEAGGTMDEVEEGGTPQDDFGAFPDSGAGELEVPPKATVGDDFGAFEVQEPAGESEHVGEDFGVFGEDPTKAKEPAAKEPAANGFGAFYAGAEGLEPVDDFGAFDEPAAASEAPTTASAPEETDDFGAFEDEPAVAEPEATDDFGAFDAAQEEPSEPVEAAAEEKDATDDFGAFDAPQEPATATTSEPEAADDFGAFDAAPEETDDFGAFEDERAVAEPEAADDFGAFGDEPAAATETPTTAAEADDFGAFDAAAAEVEADDFGDFGAGEKPGVEVTSGSEARFESLEGYKEFCGVFKRAKVDEGDLVELVRQSSLAPLHFVEFDVETMLDEGRGEHTNEISDLDMVLKAQLSIEEKAHQVDIGFGEFENMISQGEGGKAPLAPEPSSKAEPGIPRTQSAESNISQNGNSDPFAFCGTDDLFSLMYSPQPASFTEKEDLSSEAGDGARKISFDSSAAVPDPAAPADALGDNWGDFGASASETKLSENGSGSDLAASAPSENALVWDAFEAPQVAEQPSAAGRSGECEDWGNFGDAEATTAEVPASASAGDGDDWGNFGDASNDAVHSIAAPPSVAAKVETTLVVEKEDAPEVRGDDSKWGAFDAMISGAPDPSPPTLAPAAVALESTPSAGAGNDEWGNFGVGSVAATPVPTPSLAPPASALAPAAAVPAPAMPTATPQAAPTAASNDDWGNSEKTGEVAGADEGKPVVSEIRSDDSKWGAFDAMVSGAPDPSPPTLASSAGVGADWGSFGDSSMGEGSTSAAATPPVPSTASTSTPAGAEDWGNFGNPATAAPELEPTPQAAAMSSSEPPAATGDGSQGGDVWGAFGATTSATATPAMPVILPPARHPRAAAVQVRADKPHDLETTGTGGTTSFEAFGGDVSRTPGLMPAPTSTAPAPSSGNDFGNFGDVNNIAAPAAPQQAASNDDWGNFGGGSVAATPVPTPSLAPPASVLAPAAAVSEATPSSNDDWGNFGGVSVAAPPSSVAHTAMPMPAMPPAAASNDDWGNFGSSASATPASAAPTGAPAAGDNWGTFEDAAPTPAPGPAPSSAGGWAGFAGPSPTPSAQTPASVGGWGDPTQGGMAAPSPVPYQATPAGYGQHAATPVAFYSQTDKNSLYYQLKSAEKEREEREREKTARAEEEARRKKEEESKRKMFNDLNW